MKKKWFAKRNFLFSATLLTALGSSVVLVACSQTDFNSIKQIKVTLPFGVDGKVGIQGQTFKTIVDEYNKWLNVDKTTKSNKGYLPVTISNVLNYGVNSTNLQSRLAAKDYSNLPNLSFGYASNIFDLNQNRFLMDLSKPTNPQYFTNLKKDAAKADPKNDKAKIEIVKAIDPNDAISKNLFNSSLVQKINGNTSGVPADGLYLLPIGVSTDLLYINKVVMNYLLGEALKQTNFTIKSNDKSWFKTTFGVESKSNSNVSSISASKTETSSSETKKETEYTPDEKAKEAAKNFYHEIKADAFTDEKNKYEISKETFQTYEGLFELSAKLAEAFKSSSVQNPKQIISFTPSNYMEIASFIKGKADYSKFLWTREANGNYNYKFLKNKESNGAKNLESVYQTVFKAGKLGAVWAAKGDGKGQYPFDDFKNNKLAFSIASNSGYTYLFTNKTDDASKKQVKKSDIFIANQPLKNKNTDSEGAFTIQGGSLFGIKFDDARIDHATRLFVKWLLSKNSSEGHAFSVEKTQTNGAKEVSSGDKDSKIASSTSKTTEAVSGFEYYALKSNYISGLKEFFTDDKKNLLSADSAKVAFEIYKTLSPDLAGNAKSSSEFSWGFKASESNGFSEPVGDLSSTFRSLADGAFTNYFSNSEENNNKFFTFDSFWKKLTNNNIIQSWIARN